ncbi:MAG: type II secretion system protein [Planctomycetes bacterium]|nr:type II secretion system protein [Planctomycetota bacterium]
MTKQKKQSGFTLVELLVAMGLLAAIFVASGFIFRAAIKAQKTAKAVLEITQKLQTITSQLDTDFKGIDRDGEIFIAWVARYDVGLGKYMNFDRIVFFAGGNFSTYHQYNGDIRGTTARVSYMLAKNNGVAASGLNSNERILARSQHLYEPTLSPPAFPDVSNTPASFTELDNNNSEYYTQSLAVWKSIPDITKGDILTTLTDIQNISGSSTHPGGLTVDTSNPSSIHMLLAEGVGSFSVQGWNDAAQRWVPEIDPDGDGDLTDDSDYRLEGANVHSTNVIALWYPDMFALFGETSSIGTWQTDGTYNWRLYLGPINEPNFNSIPGLGRAFKFTFTIYDSKGVFPDGKVFSHIVYLD